MSKKVKVEASTENNILVFRITGRIWQGELASTLRLNIDNALENNINTVHVFMSSEGGSTFEGEDVKNEFMRMPNRKLRVGAICFSAATNIATVFGDNVEAYSTSQFMIHKPSSWFSGNEDQIEADLKLLKNITQSYRGVYSKKFKKTEAEIEELWKQDYWMTAAEAKELGLITTIIDENLEVNQETIDAMVACGCPTVPKLSEAATPEASPKPTTEQINSTMDINQLRSIFGMSADATEEQVLAKAREVNQSAATAAKTQTDADEAKKKAAKKFATQAVLDKKIKAMEMPAYESLHLQDPTAAETLVKDLPALTAGSEFLGNQQNSPEASDKSKWTLDDYLEKDPKAFEELIKTDPEKAKQLNAAYQLKNS
jgi:ATP-dependent Clp protease protease subunit